MSDSFEDQMKEIYMKLPVFAPFSVEPKDEDVESLQVCAENMKYAGDSLYKATGVLTQAIIIASRSVLNRNEVVASFRLGSECRLAENEVSTEASIAWQIARMLLRSGLVKIEGFGK